jgi:Rrf2 family protein
MLSQKTRYALKALVLLAESERQDKGPVLISELAHKGRIPQKFLEAILLELKHFGILRSKKGKGGGYLLGRTPDEIKVGEVVRIFDGPLALVPCASPRHSGCDECRNDENAGVNVLFKEVRDATANILDGATLAKVLQVQEKLRENKQVMYFI